MRGEEVDFVENSIVHHESSKGYGII